MALNSLAIWKTYTFPISQLHLPIHGPVQARDLSGIARDQLFRHTTSPSLLLIPREQARRFRTIGEAKACPPIELNHGYWWMLVSFISSFHLGFDDGIGGKVGLALYLVEDFELE